MGYLQINKKVLDQQKCSFIKSKLALQFETVYSLRFAQCKLHFIKVNSECSLLYTPEKDLYTPDKKPFPKISS